MMSFLLIVYIPVNSVAVVTQSLFNAGAGVVGHYHRCGWSATGMGQFAPQPGANPTIGKVGELEYVEEVRFECMVRESVKDAVIHSLRQAHPYEEPMFWLLRNQI